MPKISKNIKKKIQKKTKLRCVACRGSGKNSRGGVCVPCDGKGRKVNKQTGILASK